MKYGKLTLGQIEAVVNKLGGLSGVQRLLSGDLIVTEVSRPWREEHGVIRFSVTSDGTTGSEWVYRLQGEGVHLSAWAMNLLLSKDFRFTAGSKTQIAVMKGELFSDTGRVTANIHSVAEEHGLWSPHTEVACLIRAKFSDKQIRAMGLERIIIMHEPLLDSVGDQYLLGTDPSCSSPRLYAYGDNKWSSGNGFAFVECTS